MSPRPVVPFLKAQACGNDFLLVDAVYAPPDMAAFTRAICDRHRGVGADGVEWLSSAPDADVRARLINADGSDAEISGNGTRCVAAYYASRHPVEEVVVRTGAGLKRCRLKARRDPEFDFAMEMGAARVLGEVELQLGKGSLRGIQFSIGNPQFVALVEEFPAAWQALGAEAGSHRHFPEGTNVEFARVLSRHQVGIRIFERGAGETQSSGTGSCAAAVAAIHAGRADSPVVVVAPGGSQSVRVENGEVFLDGPARLVCSGEFFG